jgi:FAD/FMN-containing dehydrogenase
MIDARFPLSAVSTREAPMTIEQLARQLQGSLLRPGNDGFDEACRCWNGRFNHRPDLIAQCRHANDVRACVDFARGNQVTLSVKGGGHSYAGKTVGDGGLLVDVSQMKGIRVSTEGRTAIIEPGVTCGELDRAAREYGVATPTPTVSTVGVIGAALGGGSGYLSRKHGLTLDNVLSVDIVTADGREVTASEREHPDLFWALRGAGANFGVATSMQIRLHDVAPEVLAGQIIYPFDDAEALLKVYRDFMARSPDEVQCYPFMFRIPPIDAFPAKFHGQPALDFVLCHVDARAVDAVQPLRELGDTILDLVGPLAYTAVQQGFDANLPKGQRYYSRAHLLDMLSDAAIHTITEHVTAMEGAFTAAYLEPYGGAIGRVGPSETAFHGRKAAYSFHILAGWTDASDDHAVMTWARAFHEAMAVHATGGVYVNLLGEDEADRVPAAYGGNYRRLVELKTRWDPDNLFRMNYNVQPI